MKERFNLVWYKRDLRLQDHAPLCAAVQAGDVIPIYIIEPELWKQPDSSRRHWHFLHDSLLDLDAQLANYGGRLIIRQGEVLSVLEDLRGRLGTFTLWSHEETGNAWTYKRDIEVAKWCGAHGVAWHEFPSHGVVRRLKSRNGWAKIRDARMADHILTVPNSLRFIRDIASEALPSKDDPLFGMYVSANTQKGGRARGMSVLNSFLSERARKYILTISKPGPSARHCSRLSPHIAYGTLSVREIEQATKQKMQSLRGLADEDAKYLHRNLSAFLSRLAWRCHFVQKLEQQPAIETQCMHPAFEGMREPYFREDYFEAWKKGNTGYPLVDACMRSLIENGWITFRMRAMLVSFASYHLWLDWRQTAPYLAKLFTDYEPGIHYSQFQMQSGVTGINAVRMYNPIKQSLDHDSQGQFIRYYVPELKDVPDAFIHTPWHWGNVSTQCSKPIVDHDLAIRHARQQLAQRGKQSAFKDQAKEVYRRLGSRNRPSSRVRKTTENTKQMKLNLE